jgi:FixJ family two-component response regulator
VAGQRGLSLKTGESRPKVIAESAPTIFIVDDDDSVRRSLARLLESLGFSTETFASAEDFLKRERHEGPGCLVLDVRMPGLSGMDLQEALGKADYGMPVVFITGHGNVPMSVRAMKRGAVDFLPKPFDESELIDAINRAVEKDRQAKAERFEADSIADLIKLLTLRECEIFRYLITGMLNKQIAFRLNIAEKTVKIHRANVLSKLGAGSVADLVRMAGKVGIEPAQEQ